jgi:hypothetical protein
VMQFPIPRWRAGFSKACQRLIAQMILVASCALVNSSSFAPYTTLHGLAGVGESGFLPPPVNVVKGTAAIRRRT